MNRSKRDYKKKVNLEELSDEQLLEFIDSVDSDDDIYSSDDSVNDPDYIVDNIEPDTTAELSKSDENAIDNCIDVMNEAETTDAFVEAINFSMNISEIPSSTLVMDVAAVETVDTEGPSSSTPTTTNARFKPAKRARSPLPTVETTGPLVQPSAGGFTGEGIYGHLYILFI